MGSDGSFLTESTINVISAHAYQRNRQNIAKMYSDTNAIPLLQKIGITNANDEARFLTSGPIYEESKVSPKCVISFS